MKLKAQKIQQTPLYVLLPFWNARGLVFHQWGWQIEMEALFA